MTPTTDPKLLAMEETVRRQSAIIAELARKINFLERENKRRQSEIQSIPRK